jgi:hypothetical protein
MAKPPRKDEERTEIVRNTPGAAPAADMDNLVTTIHTRIAGHLTVTDGPGKGRTLTVHEGSNSIGRDGARNVIVLDFGDTTIHRESHVYLTCTGGKATLSTGGNPNPVSINGKMLTGTEAIGPRDAIVVGRTTLRFEPV